MIAFIEALKTNYTWSCQTYYQTSKWFYYWSSHISFDCSDYFSHSSSCCSKLCGNLLTKGFIGWNRGKIFVYWGFISRWIKARKHPFSQLVKYFQNRAANSTFKGFLKGSQIWCLTPYTHLALKCPRKSHYLVVTTYSLSLLWPVKTVFALIHKDYLCPFWQRSFKIQTWNSHPSSYREGLVYWYRQFRQSLTSSSELE